MPGNLKDISIDYPAPSEERRVRLEVVASVLVECKETGETNKSGIVIDIGEKRKKG